MMIRSLIHHNVRFSTNYAAFNVPTCSYSNPVSLSQRNLDFDLDLKEEELFKGIKPESRQVDIAAVADKMRSRFGCSETTAVDFVKKQRMTLGIGLKKMCQIFDFLSSKGFKLQTIMDHQWLFKVKSADLKLSLTMIENMKPKSLEDFLPFLRIPPLELVQIQQMLLAEKSKVPDGNRIYLLSRILGTEPIIIADFFVRYPHLLTRKVKSIVNIVKALQYFGITSDDIIKSGYVFFKSPEFITKQFTMCRDAGLTELTPVHLNLTEEQVRARVKKMNRNAEANPIEELLVERLGCEPEKLHHYLRSHKSLLTRDPAKIKERLDYLLIEAKIHPIKVLTCLRILSLKMKTLRDRLEELKAVGNHPSALSVLLISPLRFEKYLQKLGKTGEQSKLSAEL